jgi:hypothetical protein
MPPLVSVVMPCFNAGPMLRPALNSVIRQTYPNLEIIFVDNNSTDESLELARAIADETPRPMRVVTCGARGANHARNAGFAEARGDYIQWMDADDTLDADKIERQVAALELNRGFDIAYCDWSQRRVMPGAAPLVVRHSLAQLDDQITRTLATVWYPPHVYLLRRRAADRLQARQAWWPERKVTTDIEYSAIAALLGCRFLYVPGAHVHYNVWSAGQLSSGTPFPERAEIFRDMFARLQREAALLGPTLQLNGQHKILLHQRWDVWQVPEGSLVLTPGRGRRAQLAHRPSGRTIELGARDAGIMEVMLRIPVAQPLCHHARFIARRIPALERGHAQIVASLQRLAGQGFFRLVARIGDEAEGQAAR